MKKQQQYESKALREG